MKNKLRIVMAQLNLKVGDLAGNLEKHRQAIKEAKTLSADVIMFPELSITGYTPEDLLTRKSFIEDANAAVKTLAAETKEIYCLVGHPYFKSGYLRNGCSLLYQGQVVAMYAKQRLPNYSVFDEDRYFKPGNKICVVPIHGIPMGILICEDLWSSIPAKRTANAGAKIILTINASPFVTNKHARRVRMLCQRAKETHLPVLYACNVGGQDELIFDGDSMGISAAGDVCCTAGFFNETLKVVDLEYQNDQITLQGENLPELNSMSAEEKVYKGLVLALRDYVEKNNFPGVLIGISGGIDSALTLALAVDALGKDRVRAIFMPSRYSSELSLQEAKAVTQNFGVATETISIEPAYESFLKELNFQDKNPDVTEQNIQARCRAVILMALSNKTGYMVLNTGNRSELAVGYCTIYGDMVGGFAPLKDVYKTLVYKLAKYRNQVSPVIPEQTITRAPTAELAPNQKDEDSLPPYDVLDRILEAYLDLGQSVEEVVAQGFNVDVVHRVASLVRKSEYKRKQGAIGPRIHRRSFGKAWRYPITNGYKG